jgi:hypothetical protein
MMPSKKYQMGQFQITSTTPILIFSLIGYLIISLLNQNEIASLGRLKIITGYSLLGIFVFLTLFNLRKRISVLPQLGRAFWWHQAHIILGAMSFLLYILHVDNWWPENGYEQWVAFFYIVVFGSGLLGLLIQTIFPKKMTEIDEEVVFERVPDAVAELKNKAASLVENAVKKYQSETILRLYQEHLSHYFAKPRFTIRYVMGSQTAEFKLQNQIDAASKYCNKDELEVIEELKLITTKKINIDRQYAYQLALKLWLFVHVPAVTGLMILAIWHLLLVNIYSI